MFQSYEGTERTIVIGTVIMQEHYVVFDSTPYDQYGQNFIQIGIAPKNFDVDIASLRYDYSSNAYSPENKTDDSSIIINGFQDQYNATPVNPDPIKPIQPDDAKNQTNNTGKGNETANNGDHIIPDNVPIGDWI